ncbi:OLC1v1002602C1 [Oldenlandia corymbosa var. corymbosa]|uniref:OLC1v1002602C1 n=1 Tax=Oldenlandia corymbosa var. corymbosa TaxID=529605 RepID=A0AAV1D878_OLDCO|nr:OLC1v1002602C1 [Oldenlandia corymbosa var. corymbosa]
MKGNYWKSQYTKSPLQRQTTYFDPLDLLLLLLPHFLSGWRGESEIIRRPDPPSNPAKMDFHRGPGGSPSSSTSSVDINPNNSTSYHHHHHHQQNGGGSRHNATTPNHNNNHADPMHSWWESISKARTRIHLLSTLLPETSSVLTSLADSDRPARSLLLSSAAYSAVSSSLSSPNSGSGDDPFCQWLYETFLSGDPDLRLVVLSYIPLLSSVYLSRIHSSSSTTSAVLSATPSLAGFEAVLLVLYSSEVKARSGKPILISIPDLSQPSLYHNPRNNIPNKSTPSSKSPPQPPPRPVQVGVLSPPLEPQMAVKSTKRAGIVGIALDCYYKQISQMPSWSKLHFCEFAADWAAQDCPCKSDFDDFAVQKPDNFAESSNGSPDNLSCNEIEDVAEGIQDLRIEGSNEDLRPNKGVRIPLPWELLQPMLRILGHCLLGPLNSEDVKDAASVAVRCLYARASHDLNPQAILATRSLVQLDKRAREAAAAALAAAAASNANTPSKAKKQPEMLLVAK